METMIESPGLARHRQDREDFLTRAIKIFQADQRVVAAWLEGSLAWGTADAWSDLDLHVVIADDEYVAFVERRRSFFEALGCSLLAQELRVNTQNDAFFTLLVYPGGLEVDCSLWQQRKAHRPEVSRLVLDRAGIPVDALRTATEAERRFELQHQLNFFWGMAVVGVKCVGRGFTFGAANQIDLMAYAYDTLWRFLYRPDAPNLTAVARRHRPVEPELAARIPRLGAVLDPIVTLAAIRRLCASTEELHRELAPLGVLVPADMPGQIEELATLAEEEIQTAVAILRAPE